MSNVKKRVISVALAFLFCLGTVPVGAVPNSTQFNNSLPKLPSFNFDYRDNLSVSLENQSREDIVAAAIESLIADGKVKDIQKMDDDLVETVLEESGTDFEVVKTYFADALISERATGHIDATRYALRMITMKHLLEYIREERNMGEDIFEYSLVTNTSGIVTDINYEIAEIYSGVLDELEGINTPVEELTLNEAVRSDMSEIYGGEFVPNDKVSDAVSESEEVLAATAEENAPILYTYFNANESYETDIMPQPRSMALMSVDESEGESSDNPTDSEDPTEPTPCDYIVEYKWADILTYKDLNGNGITNSDDSLYKDTGDYILVYDPKSDDYYAQPAKETIYKLESATLKCTTPDHECGDVNLTKEDGLVIGAYMVVDTITLATQILDRTEIQYNPQDNASILIALQTLTDYMDYMGEEKDETLQKIHVLVTNEEELNIAYELLEMGVGKIENMTSDNAQELAMSIGSTLFYASYTDDNGVEHTEIQNGTKIDLIKNYNAFRYYYYAKPEYFGFPTDYWTNKGKGEDSTQGTPFGALKTMTQYDVNDLVPTYYLNYMSEMLGQAMIAYCYQTPYADMLVHIRDNAKEVIESLGDATNAQKLLVIHDYLANIASFDMNAIIQMKSNPDYSPDPLGMLPFAAVVSDYSGPMQGMYGSLCLGYTAAFNYLVQWVLIGVDETSNGYKLKENQDIDIDFVQIRYHSDIEESSVAGSDSGFTDNTVEGASTVFNETHYMSAVSLDGGDLSKPWYYVDASYDDIHTETMTQYRVETDGSVSHSYFLVSPDSMAKMYKGKYDYFDSAYDGVVYRKATANDIGEDVETSLGYDLSESSNFSDGALLTVSTKDGYIYDRDGYVVYVYEKAGQDEVVNSSSNVYEEAWFSYSVSSIVWDDDYFYYIHDNNANKLKLLRQMGDMGDFGGDMGNMGDMFNRSGAEYANRLVRRSRFTDTGDFVEDETYIEQESGGLEMNIEFYVPNDEYTKTLFHYGFATSDPEKIEAGEAYAAGNANDIFGGNGSDNAYDEFMTEDEYLLYLRNKDVYFNNNYPDIYHGLGLNGNNIYFSFADQIYKYDIKEKTRQEENLSCATSSGKMKTNENGDKIPTESLYDTVTGYFDGRAFTGMGYYTNPSVADNVNHESSRSPITVSNRPIAGFTIRNKAIFNLDKNGKLINHENMATPVIWVPIAVVSIGTNYAQSYLRIVETDENGIAVLDSDGYVIEENEKSLTPYSEEVPEGVYDSEWNRFTAEDGARKKNTQLMWCANIVDYSFLDKQYQAPIEEKPKTIVTIGEVDEKIKGYYFRTVTVENIPEEYEQCYLMLQYQVGSGSDVDYMINFQRINGKTAKCDFGYKNEDTKLSVWVCDGLLDLLNDEDLGGTIIAQAQTE